LIVQYAVAKRSPKKKNNALPIQSSEILQAVSQLPTLNFNRNSIANPDPSANSNSTLDPSLSKRLNQLEKKVYSIKSVKNKYDSENLPSARENNSLVSPIGQIKGESEDDQKRNPKPNPDNVITPPKKSINSKNGKNGQNGQNSQYKTLFTSLNKSSYQGGEPNQLGSELGKELGLELGIELGTEDNNRNLEGLSGDPEKDAIEYSRRLAG
jgi:hypothetical protein